MDKLNSYRQIIRQILQEYVELDNRQKKTGVESFLVADLENDNYFWLNWGWANERRVKTIQVFVRIHDGKFWIEEDRTEDGIANELLARGVPREDIVLAFQPPEMRQFTEFAAA